MTNSDPAKLRDSEKAVLVLQGGGALGAYQAGVFERLARHGIVPSWLCGVSIGAINSAIIAGNPPERRIERLREFWGRVSSQLHGRPLINGGAFHEAFNEASAFIASTWGIPGFFKPRLVPPIALPDGTPGALSFYDTTPLQQTLEELIDFDLLNNGEIRLSLGAVNIKSGNYIYFDTTRDRIGPEHIMASGALPPGLPPVRIDGDVYWDGGIVSNTPLQAVLDEDPQSDLCVFQVDVFSASGDLPLTIFDVYEREKEIRFSSRTRLNTDLFVRIQKATQAIGRLLDRLPPEIAASEEAMLLRDFVPRYGTNIVHLIYRKQPYEASTYDYEFSRVSVEAHWKAGCEAVTETLQNPRWLNRSTGPGQIEVLDLTRPDQHKKEPVKSHSRLNLDDIPTKPLAKRSTS